MTEYISRDWNRLMEAGFTIDQALLVLESAIDYCNALQYSLDRVMREFVILILS